MSEYTLYEPAPVSFDMDKVAYAFAWWAEILRLQRVGGRRWQNIIDARRMTITHADVRGSRNRQQRRAGA